MPAIIITAGGWGRWRPLQFKGAVETLGIHPGDEAGSHIEANNGTDTNLSIDYDGDFSTLCLKKWDSLSCQEPGNQPVDPLKAAWGKGVEEKFRKMGITL